MEKDRNNNNGAAFQNGHSNLEGRLRLEDFKGDKNEYISLTEASRYTPYSQEYLSLRARQGKLKAEKIGRDWMTKISWVKEYLKHVNGNNGNGAGKAERIKIIFSYQAVLKYSVLALVVFSVGIFTTLNWQAYQPRIKNNILTISSQTKKDFKNLTQIFKTDYSYKTKKIVHGFKNINYQVAGSSTKILSVSKNTITSTIYSFETSLIKIKQTSKLTLGSINNSTNNFSQSFKAADKEVSQFTIAWKNNIADFFTQTKKNAAQSWDDVFVFTGKNLTSLSDTILWPGKQLGETLVLASKISQQLAKFKSATTEQKINSPKETEIVKTGNIQNAPRASSGIKLTKVKNQLTQGRLALQNYSLNLWTGLQEFFSDTKKSAIRSTQNFAQAKKSAAQSADDVFVFTGKSLTLASETILWPGKQLGKTLTLTTKTSKTMDDKINYFVLAQKNNITNFFAQTKKDTAQSTHVLVVSTGKSLTSLSDTILWPGKQLGETLVLASKISQQLAKFKSATTEQKINSPKETEIVKTGNIQNAPRASSGIKLTKVKNQLTQGRLALQNYSLNLWTGLQEFFSDTKKSAIRSTQNFAQAKKSAAKSADDIFVFTGKSLTLASETILWPGKQLGQTLISTSNSINTIDDKVSQFTFAQKKNISGFFVQVGKSTVQKIQSLAQTKKNAAQSMDNAFASASKNLVQAKKNAIQSTHNLVFSTGKNLTLASETILWPGKQLGKTLIFTSDLIKTTREGVGQFTIARKKNISDFSIQTKKSAVYTTQSFVQGLGIVKKSANQKYTHAQGSIKEGWFAARNLALQSFSEIESSASKGWSKLSSKLGDGYLALLDYLIPEREFASQEAVVSKQAPKDAEVGAVILPATGEGEISQNKYLLQEVEKSFSDEVTVEKSKDGKAGIITPTKPAVPGEKYMYMLVPIEKSNIKNQNAK